MFFATDLDRTLIYSGLFLEQAECSYELVEVYEGKNISYMSTQAINLLKQLHSLVPIVPITTRNEMQYKRISAFQEMICPELYVVNNGGTIIYKGREDEVWTKHIKDEIEALSVGYEEALGAFLEAYQKPIKSYHKSDDLIWLIIGERNNIDELAVTLFKETFEPKGWEIKVNGKKIYLYPKCINKCSAMQYIEKIYYNGPIIAAGDSILDYQMVHEADYGLVPKAAYIEGECQKHIWITEHSGLRAAEDILKYAIDQAEQILYKGSNMKISKN